MYKVLIVALFDIYRYNNTMEKYFTTGQFAKKAGTTQRTIRYYDKIGLLKPTCVLSNGYRQYSKKDLIKLQRIIALQHLGFSLEEIFPMLIDNHTVEDSFKQSIKLQIKIINKKINHLEGLKEALIKTDHLLEQGIVEWDKIAELIKLSEEENVIVQQYRSTNSLLKKIELHNKFSTNSLSWYAWIYQQIDFSKANKLLDIGCGNGELWKQNKINLRHREFFLTDINKSMLEETSSTLHEEFNYMIMDCENITFKKEYFDVVIANHVLFYIGNVDKGLKEIHRVLKNDASFYCTAYGARHMKEIEELVKMYNADIYLMESKLYEKFGLENGEQMLANYFREIELRMYQDVLQINDPKTLMEYIMSCPGNQNEIIGKDIAKFKDFISQKIKEKSYIEVKKEVGIFICRK